MSSSNSSMTYEEAVKYMEKHEVITRADIINLESKCDYDAPIFSAIDRRYLEAQRVIKEQRVQDFLNYKQNSLN
jgi:hypothetical protein